MQQLTRMSRQEQALIWDRLAAGDRTFTIAHGLGRSTKTIKAYVERAGGVRPRCRTRADRNLSFEEREEISRGLARGESLRCVAARLGRAPSTVSREIARNSGRSRYRAHLADTRAWARAERPKPTKLGTNPRLRRFVERRLDRKWSPEQISGWLATHIDDDELQISHETIYLSLFVQGKGALRKELHQALRTGRAIRRPKAELKRTSRIPNMVHISERPAEVEDRAVPGHWEGDLIIGSRRTCIGTLVERSTRFCMLLQLNSGTADEVRAAMTRQIKTLPRQLFRTLTWDQGNEMATYERFSIDTGINVYFCDPSSPWQRGTNENTNGLLRQYFPKGTNLGGYTQKDLDKVARELNGRPRKTLGYDSPLERIRGVVASTR